MQGEIKKILFVSFFVSISFVFLFNSENVVARNLKSFVVEKSGSDTILISDGYSQYIIDHSYSCYDSQFIDGSTIYIDTYYSPSYGDDIIISGYTNTVCEVTDSDKVNIKQYYVDNTFDSEDKIIVSNSSGKYLVEYGIGCSVSMWRYEGKKIDIDVGGAFLDGIGDTIYLFDSGRDCRVWDAEELSGGGYGDYAPPSSLSKTCPINSSLVGSGCVCNEGYVASGSACITYTQTCQNKYGVNSYGDKNYCYCNTGYEWNSDKTACLLSLVCPANSTKTNNQCICNEGYIYIGNACITYDQSCQNKYGVNSYGDKSNCYCNDGYKWNSSQTACVKIEVVPDIEQTQTEQIQQKQVQTEQVQKDENNTEVDGTGQELPQSYPDTKEEKPLSFWDKIFSPIKNLWNWIFK